MRPIESEFDSRGFHFRLVKRAGLVALFAKKQPDVAEETFEVVHLTVYPEAERFGKMLPEREAMPSTESWGKCGWSYSDRQSAEKRFLRECADLILWPNYP